MSNDSNKPGVVETPHSPNSPDDLSSFSKFVKTLDKYKELITVIVFFLGGVLWAFDYFATKRQVNNIRCLLEANVQFLQSKIDYGTLSQTSIDNIQERSPLEAKQTLSPDEIVTRDKLRSTAQEIARKLAEDDKRITEALTKLMSGQCLED